MVANSVLLQNGIKVLLIEDVGGSSGYQFIELGLCTPLVGSLRLLLNEYCLFVTSL